MTVNLGIISGLITGEVTPEQNAGADHQNGRQEKHSTEAWIARAVGRVLKSSLTRRQRRRNGVRTPRGNLRFRRSLGDRLHGYFPFRYCLTPCSAWPMARAYSTLARLWEYRLEI